MGEIAGDWEEEEKDKGLGGNREVGGGRGKRNIYI